MFNQARMCMRGNQNPFPTLALAKAESPVVRDLFRVLESRAREFAGLEDQFSEASVRLCEQREGKPFEFSKAQQRTIANFQRDAEQAEEHMRRFVASADDASLVVSCLLAEEQQLDLDLKLRSRGLDGDAKELADKIIQFRRETIELVEGYIPRSALSEKINGQLDLLRGVRRR
jgi:hypothetical protein